MDAIRADGGRGRRLRALVLLMVFAGLAALAAVAHATIRTTSNVPAGRFSASTQDEAGPDDACIIGAADAPFVDMVGTEVQFNLGGGPPRPVVAFFQANWVPNTDPNFGGGAAFVRLVIDGVPVLGPGTGTSALFPEPGRGPSANGWNFVTQPLQPGPHTAKIQWRAAGANDRVCADERSLIVLHR